MKYVCFLLVVFVVARVAIVTMAPMNDCDVETATFIESLIEFLP